MRACLRVAISEFGVATTSVRLGHQLPCPIDPCNRSPNDQRSGSPDRAGPCSIFPLDIDTHTHYHRSQPSRQPPPSLLLQLPTKKKRVHVVKSTSNPTSESPISWPNSSHQDLTPAPCEAVGLSCSSHVEVFPLLLQK